VAAANIEQSSLQFVYPKFSPTSKAVYIRLDFSKGNPYSLDLLDMKWRGFIDCVKSIFIDASLCTQTVSIALSSGQVITAQAGSQGYYPVIQTNTLTFSFANASGSDVCAVFLLNDMIVEGSWKPGGSTSNVTIVNPLGQHPMAASVAVVVASDQSSLPVTVGNFPATQPVSGTVAVSNFPATQAENLTQVGGAAVSLGAKSSANSIPVVPATDYVAPVNIQDFGGSIVALGQQTKINSMPVTIASDQPNLPVSGTVTANQGTAAGATAPWPVYVVPSQKAIYSGSPLATPPATPTDLCTIFGSGTKTVRVLRAEVWLSQTTAGQNTFYFIKRSTANSGGTSTSPAIVPHDSNFAAATATVVGYSANPTTLGTSVGNVYRAVFRTPAPADISPGNTSPLVFDFTNSGQDSGIVLRGVAQGLCLSLAGVALPAGLTVLCKFDWSEE